MHRQEEWMQVRGTETGPSNEKYLPKKSDWKRQQHLKRTNQNNLKKTKIAELELKAMTQCKLSSYLFKKAN